MKPLIKASTQNRVGKLFTHTHKHTALDTIHMSILQMTWGFALITISSAFEWRVICIEHNTHWERVREWESLMRWLSGSVSVMLYLSVSLSFLNYTTFSNIASGYRAWQMTSSVHTRPEFKKPPNRLRWIRATEIIPYLGINNSNASGHTNTPTCILTGIDI